jgi:predicted nucleic acid-binding protein
MSVVGYAEITAIFARRWREKLLHDKQREVLQDQFQDDWLFNIDRIELTVGVLGFIPTLVKRHPLKGSDSIHLASALWLRDAVTLGKRLGTARGSLTFATSDKQLKMAASAEGLQVFDPEDEN